MARKQVTVDVCDRCPTGKEKPATHHGIPLSLGEEHWVLDLCDQHKSDLQRDVFAWGRLGREREVETRFGQAFKDDARRLAELRTVQAAEDAERVYTVRELANPLRDPLESLPAEAGDWVFTDHARMRMEERGVGLREILMTVCKPNIRRPARDRDKAVYVGVGAQVVVNPKEKVIVTVAMPNQLRRAQ